jgi:hypothetical protein
VNTPIAYAMHLQPGESRRKILCLDCCGGEAPKSAREVFDTHRDRARFGVPSGEVVCHKCGERLDGAALLRVYASETSVLRFALDHALASISEAHPDDRARLQALITRLEGASV